MNHLKKAAFCLASAVVATASTGACAAELFTSEVWGNINSAYTIGGPYAVTQQFDLSDDSLVSGISAVFWTEHGHTPVSLTWSLGTTAFGTDVATGSATLSSSFAYQPPLAGYDAFASSFALPSQRMAAGSYYLTFENGVQDHQNWPLMWGIAAPSYSRHGQQSTMGFYYSAWNTQFTIEGQAAALAVPEPSGGLMTALGLAVVGWARRRNALR